MANKAVYGDCQFARVVCLQSRADFLRFVHEVPSGFPIVLLAHLPRYPSRCDAPCLIRVSAVYGLLITYYYNDVTAGKAGRRPHLAPHVDTCRWLVLLPVDSMNLPNSYTQDVREGHFILLNLGRVNDFAHPPTHRSRKIQETWHALAY